MALKGLEYIWISLWTVLTGYVVRGGEYCTYTDDNGSNRYIYCDGYCCSSEDDHCCTNYVGLIVGCVIGGIVLLAVVITVVVVVCKKHHMKKGRVIQPVSRNTRPQQGTMMYSAHFTQAPQPPPYSYGNPYPNQYGVGPGPSYGPAYPPPPAYPGPPGQAEKNGHATYSDSQGVSHPMNINVQPPSHTGQLNPAYLPPPSY